MGTNFSPALAKRIEVWPIEKVIPYERNARTHSPEQVRQISASILEFGFVNPILVDSKDGVIAGHGRLLAAQDLALKEVPVVVLDHLSDTQKKAYVIADNKLALNAGWDETQLREEMFSLQAVDFDLELTGFKTDDLEEFLDGGELEDEFQGFDNDPTTEEEDEKEKSDGSLLSLVNIAIDEPKHQVETGDIWKVGPHLLFIGSVIKEWSVWNKYLNDENCLFCPYPGPFVPLGKKADDNILIMVQPDKYVAGHLLDRYVEIKGEGSVAKGGEA
tara:strand:- start:9325 stop:10146 length:822 start_codon:yes stop_codon:yes gene_type:complete